ncbi:MAG: UDP-3-O-(3-hydroxymyristoyl)glucosamine N-acyltransferase [Gammaproteobacteria bacterium]|jgi:UDP-3-O-[3-hydroxymyristoyl] glucosamine N-acyltransferase|nr:UDP-3-O-(3-hydroxymyristoyl)glucosamine N-acyltransferase [Gammaproteobacteria bacterium]MDH3751288.1 UDP-3-O-(3-hydroxymyristoyl)glucosamine N-acyltransferase [Gammaproteobacteria bacterium]MDH3805881.1 UDP-3-O-(3-hydroxymyristoyl)glucosamine N-acyltransferase [Gammaproteobacteria bacterium]
MPISLRELAERFDCELIGDPDVIIDTVGSLCNAGPNALSFLAGSAFKKQLASTKAAAVIMRADDAQSSPTAVLVDDNPYACYARMAAVVCPGPVFKPDVHSSAVVATTASIAKSVHIGANAVVEDGATIGENTYIGPGAIVGPDCVIGDDCRLNANVTFVRNVTIGDRCIFHSGSVVGADGFGNAMTPEGWIKVPQLGGVRVGNDVEVGSNTTIDCGAIDDTVIEDGVRLDNLIQIGHNVHIGEHTAMATACAIAGSARIGKRCMFAGMVGMAGHIEVCDDVVVNGKGMVSKNITEPGAYASNFPIEPVRDWNRRVAKIRRLDKLIERVSKLEQDAK